MSFARSSLSRTLVSLVVSGCVGGTGSGLVGIARDNAAVGGSGPRVLAFFVQPNTANVGEIITPPVQVVARDTLGNTDSTFSAGVSVSLAANPTGASLGGTTAAAAIRGIATFRDLRVDRAGTYTLRATAAGATAATSAAFTVTTATP
jgi:hypothetical protein